MPRTYNVDVHSNLAGQYPWTSHRLDLGEGVQMAYVDEGPPNAPLTFLLLHGNPTWSFIYRTFITHLSPRFRVLAPDMVGHGRSDKPHEPSYYALERHVQNLSKLLQATQATNVVPVMQDWGGPVGTGWATRNPDRVAGLVVLNTWAFVRDPPMKLPWIFKFLLLGRGGWKRITERNFFVEFLMPRSTARKLTPAERDGYRAPFPTPLDRVGLARWPQLIPETHNPKHESWATMATIEDALPRIADKPALLVWALKDVAFRKPHLERWRKLFHNLDGPHTLPQAKHYLQEDASEEILARIDAWVASRWGAKATNGASNPVPVPTA